MKKMKKALNIIWIGFLVFIILWIFYNFHDVMFIKHNKLPDDTINLTWYVVSSWDIATWDLIIDTWNVIDIELLDIDKFNSYKERWDYLSFYPQKQPYKKSEWYSIDTSILNQYLAKNTNYIDISRYPWLKNWWYLYVRTKLAPTDWIFMYWYNAYWSCWKPVSWKLIQSDKYKISDTEYLYPLDWIEMIAYYNKKNCIFDWKEQINSRKNQYIWWYVASTKWNTIEEITIARE